MRSIAYGSMYIAQWINQRYGVGLYHAGLPAPFPCFCRESSSEKNECKLNPMPEVHHKQNQQRANHSTIQSVSPGVYSLA